MTEIQAEYKVSGPPVSKGRPLLTMLIGAIFLMTLLGTLAVWMWGENTFPSRSGFSELPAYGKTAEFTLMERNGENFSSETLKGKIWIADFMFTHCPGLCPRMTLEMSRLQASLPPDIFLVSFTVDPGRDSPKALSDYADTYGAEKGRWFFLTGEKAIMNQLTASFHMGPIDEPNQHSVRMVIVDADGIIRGYYDPTDVRAVQKLLEDIQILKSPK